MMMIENLTLIAIVLCFCLQVLQGPAGGDGCDRQGTFDEQRGEPLFAESAGAAHAETGGRRQVFVGKHT